MKHYLHTVTLGHVSGFPEDAVQGQFAFADALDSPSASVFATTVGAVHRYYSQPDANNDSIAEFLGPGVSRVSQAMTHRLYDITNLLGYYIDPVDGKKKLPAHGSPVQSGTGTLSIAAGGTALPEEVALVMTLRAAAFDLQPVERADGPDPGAAIDRPRQRYSGRIFHGPLGTNALQTVSGKARPTANLITCLTNAAARLKADMVAGIGGGTAAMQWCIWSRTDAVLRPVEVVQVDDAFDTQRRRGVAPLVRTTIDI